MDRFLDAFHASNAVAVGPAFDRDALVAQPAILDADSGEYFFLVPNDAEGPDTTRLGDLNPFSSAHGRMLHGMSDAWVVEGREPDPDEELEIGVDEELAAAYGVGPGDTLRLTGHHPRAVPGHRQPQQHRARRADVRLHRHRCAAAAQRRGAGSRGHRRRPPPRNPGPRAHPAFHAAHYRRDVAGASYFDPAGGEFMELQVAPGTTEDELRDQVAEAAPDAQVFMDPSEDAVASAVSDRAIGLQAAAVLAVGIVVAVVSILFLVLGLSRVLGDQAREAGPSSRLGSPPAPCVPSRLITAAVIAVVGAIGAVAISVALSPLSPVGLARRAEPDPGLHVDAAVTFVGVLGTVVVALVIALGVAARHRDVLAPATAGRAVCAARSPGRPDERRRRRDRPPVRGPADRQPRGHPAHGRTGVPRGDREPDVRDERRRTVRGAGALRLGLGALGRQPERPRPLPAPRRGPAGAPGRGRGHCGAQRVRGHDRPRRRARRGSPRWPPSRSKARSSRRCSRAGSRTGLARSPSAPSPLDSSEPRRGTSIQVGSGDCGEGQQPLTVTGIAVFNEALLATRIGEGALGRRGRPGTARGHADPGCGARGSARGDVGGRGPRSAARRLRARRRRTDRPRRPRRPRPSALTARPRRRLHRGAGARHARVHPRQRPASQPPGRRRAEGDGVHARPRRAAPPSCTRWRSSPCPALVGTALGVAAGRIGWGARGRGPRRPEPPRGPARTHARRHPGRPARRIGSSQLALRCSPLAPPRRSP